MISYCAKGHIIMHRRFTAVALALATACAALPLAAQGVAATFSAHLDRIPATALGLFDATPEIEFGDLAAATRVLAARPADAPAVYGGPFGPAVRAPIGSMTDSINPQMTDRWPATIGFGLTQVAQWSGIIRPPQRLIQITLAPGSTQAMPAALLATGYAAADAQGYPAFALGGDDFSVDLGGRNPSNPFGGNLGMASRIAIDGDTVLASPGWPLLTAAMTDTGPSLADRPDIAALLASLDALPAGDDLLITASLWLDAAQLGLADDGRGLPPWSAFLLADLSDGQTDTAALALAYPTRDQAKTAAQAMARIWQDEPLATRGDTLAALSGLALTVDVVGDGPFVALAHASGAPRITGSLMVNPAYDLLRQALYMGDLRLVAVGP
jgi:hypothetical protein